MARTALTPKLTSGPYPSLPISADDADLAFAAGDAVNGNNAAFGGRMLVVVARNDNAGAQTITIGSVADGLNRTGDIDAYSIGAGEYAVFGPFKKEGWASSDKLNIDVSSADIKIAVLQLNL